MTTEERHQGFILTLQAVCQVERLPFDVKPWRSGAGYDVQVGDHSAGIHCVENPQSRRVARRIGLRTVNGMYTFTPA